METFAYIAKPMDDRCRWWSLIIPNDLKMGVKINAPYLKKGDDLELESGDMILDSEERHHAKARGYRVSIGVMQDTGEMLWVTPTAEHKMYIKTHGGQDLMVGSGEVEACKRVAIWIRRQPDLKVALDDLRQL